MDPFSRFKNPCITNKVESKHVQSDPAPQDKQLCQSLVLRANNKPVERTLGEYMLNYSMIISSMNIAKEEKQQDRYLKLRNNKQ